MTLESKISDPERPLCLYGTAPPREEVPEDKVLEIAGKLAARLRKTDVDAINVYDIQNEEDRSDWSRPFPFLPTRDPRAYSRLLRELTGVEAISYKCVVHEPRERFRDWLRETREQFGVRYLSLVGGSSSATSYPGPTLGEAAQMAASDDFVLGGIVIAERHLAKRDEHRRLVRKARRGMCFFTSQVVYEPEDTIRLLSDYREECRKEGLAPARIVLTFAPCGHPKTAEFMKWLGVDLPPQCETAIFSDPSPLARSIEICRQSLRAILDAADTREVPLGINVESVSIYRDEIDASIELFHELKAILDAFYA
jgi:5,10-methylenetetrahydrofolate reductase